MSMETSRSIRRTIIICSTWLASATLFLAFNPAGLGLWQSAASVLASGVVTVGAIGLTWVNPRI